LTDLPLLAIVGPTGSGKSELSIAVAKKLNAEIIGCDALQIYRELNVATAKPSADELQRVPHHLVDCVDPRQPFDLARYVEMADQAIARLQTAGRLPLVVGGTGMYLRGLLSGVIEAPKVDPELRARLKVIVRRYPTSAINRWLRRIDPISAERIAPQDLQRVARALEWWYGSGIRWSDRLAEQGEWELAPRRYRCLTLGLEAPAEWLSPRIELRVEQFFKAGLVAEVAALLDAGVPVESNAMKAIGYREVIEGLSAELPEEWMREQVATHTRRYAKRQRSWFRGETDIVWIDARLPLEERLELALKAWASFQ
jgi:tRNA dimethylallyltransferase